MTITHGFFASNDVEKPTTYTQVQYARERALTIMNGIHDGIGNNFTVSASDPTAMSVVVGSGAVHAQGYWMESDAETTLQIAAADENYPRIDRVVIRVDIVANLEVSFAVLTGIASSAPTVPELTQTSAIYEIPLAQVSVAAGVTSVTAAAITDERDYRDTQNLIHHPVVYKSPAGVQSRIAYDNAGSFWMARNATYNPSTNSWTQDNTAQSSTAVRLNAGGSIELLFCESGKSTISWKSLDFSGNKAGDIKLTACASAPSGWLICNGSAVSRTTYSALFAAIGTTYGSGNGSTTFNLPNLSGRFALGVSSGHARGTNGGAETVTLTVDQIPSHNHTGSFDYVSGSDYATGNYVGKSGYKGKNYTQTVSIGNTGGGQAHNNMPPYLSLNYIIKY